MQVRIPKGIIISEPEKTGPEVEKHALANTLQADTAQTSWCYLFIHHSKVQAFTEKLTHDQVRFFIHKTIIYQRRKHSRGIQSVEKPTVSGLLFLQGTTRRLQAYLNDTFPTHHLVNNCSTHLPAVIPDSVMRPFMRVLETSPERVRFLLHPFRYYAGGNIKLRLTSGLFTGLEGYVIRIDRDRRLVMDVGGMSVAISGIHCEHFEVVEEETEKYRQARQPHAPSPQAPRPLTVLQELIDRDIYAPTTQQEVTLIALSIEQWLDRATLYIEKRQLSDAAEILFFLFEDIAHHLSPLFPSTPLDLTPLQSAVRHIALHIDTLVTTPHLPEDFRQTLSATRDSYLPQIGHLLG